MRILCRVPLVARNWARRKSETIMYIEMSLPPGKRRVIESTVYHLHPYISAVTCFLDMRVAQLFTSLNSPSRRGGCEDP